MKKYLWLIVHLIFSIFIACGDDDIEECFSPTQNLELAIAESDMGCNCNPDIDMPICVDDTSFICYEGKWSTSKVGVCQTKPNGTICNGTPLDQLDWYNRMITDLNDPRVDRSAVEITLYDFEEKQILVKDYCIHQECLVPYYKIFNCEGEMICSSNLEDIEESKQCATILEGATNPRVVFTDRNDNGGCDNIVEIDEDLYNNSTEENYTIKNVSWNGTCLKIEFESGGCNGTTWETRLIDQGVVMESFPVQRNVKMILKNEEVCLAIAWQEHSFDMDPILGQHDKIYLNIEGYDKQVLIEKNQIDDCTKKPKVILKGNFKEDLVEPESVELVGTCLSVRFKTGTINDIDSQVNLLNNGIVTFSIPPFTDFVLEVKGVKDKSLKEYNVSFDMSEFEGYFISLGNFSNIFIGNVLPVTEEEFEEQLQQKRKEINELVDVVCSDTGDWSWIAIGSKPCGGPWEYIPYLTTTNNVHLLSLIDSYNNYENLGNKKFARVSTCDVAQVPTSVKCENGKSILIY